MEDTNTKVCPACGSENATDAMVCASCGADLAQDSSDMNENAMAQDDVATDSMVSEAPAETPMDEGMDSNMDDNTGAKDDQPANQ